MTPDPTRHKRKGTSSRTPDIEDPSGAFGMREGTTSYDPLMLKLVQMLKLLGGLRSGRSPIVELVSNSVSREKEARQVPRAHGIGRD
jgi:hypothetical protein